MPEPIVGSVTVLRRYPIKSMLGEQLQTCEVTERGLHGDRTHALLDRETRRVVSAKKPRLWGGMPRIQASGTPPTVAWNGTTLPVAERVKLNSALSEHLGRDVELIDQPPSGAMLDRADPDEVLSQGTTAEVSTTSNPFGASAPEGTFFDYAPVHLITTATLDAIQGQAGSAIDPIRYRPNIVVDAPELSGFAENDWTGRLVRIGSGVVLRVLTPTPRCAIPTLAHGNLPINREALRVPARHNNLMLDGYGRAAVAGAYAEVVSPGSIHSGDPVQVD